MEAILAAISAVGFPIVACIGVAFFVWKVYNKQIEENASREEKFFQQLAAFQGTLEKFQATLDKIDMRLEYLEKYHERNE